MKTPFGVVIADLNNRAHSRAFIRLLDEYSRGNTGAGEPLRPAVRKKVVAGLKKHKSSKVYFAVYKNSVVGMAVCFSGYSTFKAMPLINIHDLIVSEKFRCMGVGSALLEYIAGAAMSEGCCKVTLEVRADNKNALSLYSKHCFSFGANPIYFMTKVLKKAICPYWN